LELVVSKQEFSIPLHTTCHYRDNFPINKLHR